MERNKIGHYLAGFILFVAAIAFVFQQMSLMLGIIALTVSLYVSILSIALDWETERIPIVIGVCTLLCTFIVLLYGQNESIYYWWLAHGFIGFVFFSFVGWYAFFRRKTAAMLFGFAMLILTVVGITSFYPGGVLVLRDTNVVERLQSLEFVPPFIGDTTPFTISKAGSVPLKTDTPSSNHRFKLLYSITGDDVTVEEHTLLHTLKHKRVLLRNTDCNGTVPEGACIYYVLKQGFPNTQITVVESITHKWGQL